MKIIHNECLITMQQMEANSIDFVVTDPPYGLSFMGKEWDKKTPSQDIWNEALRICKPGAMLAAFGGSRTHHHLMIALERAGWEIRDVIMWLYGSGFPKSHNKFGLKGYGTALKPAHEPIFICNKPYGISHLFAIILLDITNEVYQCQKLNYNVEDAETNLSDSLLLLDKVQQFTVQDHAKTIAWEKLSSVEFVIKNITSLKQELNERINQVKDLFVLTNAKENGKNNIQVQKILHGEEEYIFAAIQGIATFVTKEHIEQNIVLLWKHTLEGIFQGMNKFTTRMVINLITELRILKSCLSPTISNDIGSLSPNYEPIILAMKPLDGTYVQNVEKWGIGGINIEESRIGSPEDKREAGTRTYKAGTLAGGLNGNGELQNAQHDGKGRRPANIIFDEEAAAMLDQQTGNSASRFFYCAKASSRERNAGLDKPSSHPTVKPIALMKYIIKLLAPPNNPVLLVPFCGSGSTLVAAKELGINAIGIELNEEYCEIARLRIKHAKGPQPQLF